MAKGTLKDAIDYAQKNPKSDFAKQLKLRIQSGAADAEFAEVGLDPTKYGRPAVQVEEEVVEKKSKIPEGMNPGNIIKDAFKGGIDRANEGAEEARATDNPFLKIGGTAKFLGGLGMAAGSPLAPLFKPISDLVGEAGKGYGSLESVQDFATSPEGEATQKGAEFVEDVSIIGGTALGLKGAGPKVPGVIKGTKEFIAEKPAQIKQVSQTVKEGGQQVAQGAKATVQKVKESKVGEVAANAARDVVPTVDRGVNHLVARALELTQGDVKNISLSTGNDVGSFIAEHNLIGKNVKDTQTNIKSFLKKNYDDVRTEIGKVAKEYTPDEVPRYKEALQEIKRQVTDTPGLQKANVEIDTLLGKEKVTLKDIQRVKELMDEHFSLYKAIGDVKEGVAKQGLANIRKDLRAFIEGEVKDVTGADIRSLNNRVQTARSIDDAIDTRATRGLTRAHLSMGDWGAFIAGTMATGNPLIGAAAVLVKKISQSPSLQLRVAKWFDGLSDAQKLKIANQLEKGTVPSELEEVVELTPTE